MKECEPLASGQDPVLDYATVRSELRLYNPEYVRQGLTLVHFSAQRELLLVTEATASVHFSAQPETLLPMKPSNVSYSAHAAYKKCIRPAEKWTLVVHIKRLR